ncbi:protein disulfide-isomerase A6-like [Babylonia areolata]|uniref:protein disulfide-isomerase A6-like n=1 Tax=Babylonia areolata TaxID=304850 RepID=UPI003FD37A9C
MMRVIPALLALLAVVGAASLYEPGKDDVIELSTTNFQFRVINSFDIWLVEFYAPWCAHCQALAPEWKRVARTLKGLVRVAAINVEEQKGIGGQYSIPGVPNIKLFGVDKSKPVDYEGQRTSKDIVEYCMNYIKEMVDNRLYGKRKKATKSKPVNPADMVEVTDSTFEKEVLKHKGMVMVEFYAPWCQHCQNLAPHWKQAASDLKGKVKLCAIDATKNTVTAGKYGVEGYPAIKSFVSGVQGEDYGGGHTSADIVEWALEKSGANLAPPELLEITSDAVLKENCAEHQLCIISILPQIYDCQSKCRNTYLATLKRLGDKYKKYQWGWLWAEAGVQPALEESIEVGGFGYPVLVAVNARKMKFSLLKGQFSEKGINEFLRDLSYGKGSTAALRSAELPRIEKRDPWDGKDAQLPVEEDIDLSDVELEDLSKSEL